MANVLSTFFLMLIKPVIEQSFLLNILKLLYTVKIKDEKFFGFLSVGQGSSEESITKIRTG
jgi:hypothetical protein